MRPLHSTFVPTLLAIVAALGACTSSTQPGFDGVAADRLLGTRGRPFGIGASPAGTVLALQLDELTASRFDVRADTIADSVRLGPNPIDVTFTSTGALAYATLLDGPLVYEVDLATGLAVDSFAVGGDHHRILMHPDDSRFYLTSRMSGRLWSVNRAAGIATDSLSLGAELRGISRDLRNGRLAVAGAVGTVWLVDGNTLDVLDSTVLGGRVQEVVHSGGGARIFAALEFGNRVMVLDATTLAVEDSIMFGVEPVAPFGMRLSRDGLTLLVSSPASGRVAVVDATTLVVRRVIATGGVPRRIALSHDGRRAFVANEAGWVDVLR